MSLGLCWIKLWTCICSKAFCFLNFFFQNLIVPQWTSQIGLRLSTEICFESNCARRVFFQIGFSFLFKFGLSQTWIFQKVDDGNQLNSCFGSNCELSLLKGLVFDFQIGCLILNKKGLPQNEFPKFDYVLWYFILLFIKTVNIYFVLKACSSIGIVVFFQIGWSQNGFSNIWWWLWAKILFGSKTVTFYLFRRFCQSGFPFFPNWIAQKGCFQNVIMAMSLSLCFDLNM